jgi:hypothetical protein
LLSAFATVGVYLLMWAFQSASYSVAAEPWLSEIYKAKALLLLPLGVLFIAVGALFFICLKRKAGPD